VIDAPLAVKTWLLLDQVTLPGGVVKQNALPGLLQSMFTAGGAFPNNNANRVYVGHLVPGFDPQYGPGVVILVGSGTTAGTGGGSAHPEIPIAMPRMQITVFAQPSQYYIARQIYRAIYDWIQRMNNVELGFDDQGNHVGYVMSCTELVEGQDVDDPKTGDAMNISFWKLMLRET